MDKKKQLAEIQKEIDFNWTMRRKHSESTIGLDYLGKIIRLTNQKLRLLSGRG